MSTAAPPPSFTSQPVRGQPTWHVAARYPFQGDWTADEFFQEFGDDRGYEFVDGVVEKLPVPTKTHQRIAKWFVYRMDEAISARSIPGEAFLMGFRTYTTKEKYREPDALFLFDERESSDRNATGMDIAVEVVSDAPSDRERDLVTKRAEYAAAGVPEYWIVDAREAAVFRLSLEGGEYAERVGRAGDVLESAVLPGLAVDVAECLAAGGA